MVSRQRSDMDLARDLIKLSLGDTGLKEFGHYPLFRAVSHAFDRSEDLPYERPQICALAEDALWRAVSEWLAGRSYQIASARETLAAAKREGFDLVQRARELLLPRQFLR